MMLEDLGSQRRQAVRRFASGVAVLTVWHGDCALGVTVSAVTAVAREPASLAVCLRRDSMSMRAVQRAGRFALNVLTTEQDHLTRWFADPQRPAGLAQFDYVDWEPDAFSGAPLISGALAQLGCLLTQCIPAGDHNVLLADVVTAASAEGRPLLHFAGRLHAGQPHTAVPGSDVIAARPLTGKSRYKP